MNNIVYGVVLLVLLSVLIVGVSISWPQTVERNEKANAFCENKGMEAMLYGDGWACDEIDGDTLTKHELIYSNGKFYFKGDG